MDGDDEDNIENTIRQYFTDEEWENMPEIIRTRHKNLYFQYTSIPNAETLMPMPDFMKKTKELVNYNAGILDPSLKKVKEKEEKKRDREFKLPKSLLGSSPKKVRMNPKRSTTSSGVNYFEAEVPNDDRYIYCDNCNQDYVDFCENCGMLITVKDSLVPRGTVDRATKTVPPGVIEIQPSSVHGRGAFSLRKLPKGVQFGPYEGELCRIENSNGYSWKLKRGKLIDASDETISNWLRFVNCAAHSSRQNVVAFQYEGGLYYRTCREIDKGEELLVYYGNTFAKILGIEREKYFDPVHENVKQDYYCCKYCGLGLSAENYRDTHEKYCKFRPNRLDVPKNVEVFECKYCKCYLTKAEDKNKHEKRCKKRRERNESDITRNGYKQKPKNHVCGKCDYRTNHSGHLKKHLLGHNKENAEWYSCNICTYKTITKGKLIQHKYTHDAIGRFSCQWCFKSFNQKSILDSHLLSRHKSEISNLQEILTNKIHKCPFCPYQTIKRTNLNRHIAVHENDVSNTQKYSCDKCQYESYQKSNLTRHLRIHSGIKPYLCTSPSCNKRFNRKGQLDSHILNNHKYDEGLMKMISFKIHECSDCPYRSIQLGNLKSHIQRHHTNNNLI